MTAGDGSQKPGPSRLSRGRDRPSASGSGAAGGPRRWVRDPLVVFVALGVGVFALERLVGDALDRDRSRIVVTAEEVARLGELWALQSGREPTLREIEVLIEEAVREEILVREAERLGLDENDTIVRRRLAQKMSFLIDDTAEVEEPSDPELERYFEAHRERYREPQRITFVHVFVSEERHGGEADAVARDLLARLRESAAPGDDGWRRLGDPFMLRRQYADRTEPEIAELFGGVFATDLRSLAVEEWSGPLRSAYGLHLVRILSRTPERSAELAAVRSQVLDDLRRERRDQANHDAYRRLRARYRVQVEGR